MLEAGLVRVDGANGETKIKARCQACEAGGVHRDLQASWDHKIRPMLDELEPDRRAGTRRYVIGE